MAESQPKLVTCAACDGPVIQGGEQCNHCGATLSGNELRYIFREPDTVSVRPLVTQFMLITGVTLVLTGFQPSPMWRVFLSAVMIFYIVKGVKAWYSL